MREASPNLSRDVVEQVVRDPEFERPDRSRPDRVNAFRRSPEIGGRWVRVVYERLGDDILVINAFPDRGAERRK